MVTRQKNAGMAARPNSRFLWLSLMLGLIGIGLLVGGLYYGYGSWKLTTQGTTVEGRVVNLLSSEEDDGSTTYAPVVEYEAGGNTYSYESHNYSNPSTYQVGQEVNLIYDRDHPDKARISNFVELWLIPLLLIPFGLGTGAVAIFLMPLLSGRRRA